MKKILIVGNNDGGLYLFRAELVEKLISDLFEVHFTVPYGDKVPILIEKGASYHEIDVDRRGMNLLKDLLLLKNYKKLFSEIKPDIVLSYTVKPNIYGGLIARYLKIPFIATITGLGTALQGEGIICKIIKALYKQGLKKSSYVFFQNTQNLKFFLTNRIIPLQKSKLVNGSGVNTEKYLPQRKEHDGVNFLFISRIMREKGVIEYLEAASMLKPKYQNINFQIVGYYDEEDIKKRVDEAERQGLIQYLGTSSDTRKEMAQADCIVLPSYHEGMSNVLLEGASFGLPLITTDINGCKEAVIDGKTGYLCKPKDTNSLVYAIEKFLHLTEEERQAMGVQGREKMQNEFDRDLVVKEYVNAIKEVIQQDV